MQILINNSSIPCIFGNFIRLPELFSAIILILCLSSFVELSALPTFQSAKILPLNRLTMTFSEELTQHVAELSSDKKNITINLGTAEIKDNKTIISGEGIIKNVSFSSADNELIARIEFTEARGYTISALPFSKSIMLEVFDWSKLSADEENYRTALLGLEDGLIDEAKPELLNAVRANISDAGFFLGLALMREGKINSALKNFRFAEIKGSEIADNYAAISQIYDIKNDKLAAKQYADLYKKNTGSKSLPKINIINITEQNDFCSEPTEHLNAIINEIDTSKSENTDTITKKDTSQFANLLNDSLQNSDKSEDNIMIKYAAGILLAIILLIIYLYLKWRNQQILKLQNEQQAQSDNAKQTKNKPNINAKTTTKQTKPDFGKIIDKTLDDSESYGQNIPVATEYKQPYKKPDIAQNINKKQAIQYPQSESERNQKANDLLNIINKLPRNNSEPEKVIQYEQNRSAKIELAEHLANEQKKIKNQNIQQLPATIGLNDESIAAVAKKLGVDKGTLETKQALEKLAQNTVDISKLSEKFNLKK